MIPALLHGLGADGFSSWSLLLGGAAVFNELQAGLPNALVRHLAVPLDTHDDEAVGRLASSALGLTSAIYGIGLPLVLTFSSDLARWLRLPDGRHLTSGQLLVVVYVCVGLRAVLTSGTLALVAAREFGLVAMLTLAQPLLSNGAAILAALATRDVSATLLWFWSVQLLVVGAGVLLAYRRLRFRPWRARPDVATMRRLGAWGVTVQATEWAQTVNQQFDKFVLVRTIGLPAVGMYEVASRSIAALRSVPSSGLETFLPSVALATSTGGDPGPWLRRMTNLAAYAALVFFVAPLVVAPMFLFAWVGDMGIASSGAFTALALGAGVNLLGLPLGTLAQAVGRPALQARSAVVSIVLNVPLSLLLARKWGVEGAAVGTAIALAAGFVTLFVSLHAALAIPLGHTVRDLVRRHGAALGTALMWGIACRLAFSAWLATAPPEHGGEMRVVAGFVSAGLYAICLTSMGLAKALTSSLDDEEREALKGLASRLPWPRR
jgi:O-antigen/teichoic acid export membrane protein